MHLYMSGLLFKIHNSYMYDMIIGNFAEKVKLNFAKKLGGCVDGRGEKMV